MSKYSFLLFLSATLIMTSCDDDDDDEPTPSGPTQNIAELASASPQFSILVEALSAADLVDAVSNENATLTVFAPDNDAFNQFFDDAMLTDDNNDGSRVDEAVAALGEDAVTQLLLYHVVGLQIAAADVSGKTYAPTLSTNAPDSRNLSLFAEPANATVAINGGSGKGATVSTPDIFATNGVIHEIDGVLELPSVVDHAIFNSDFMTLVSAVTTADLVATLDTTQDITVFAPTDDAFSQITVPNDVDELTAVLTYHVLGNQVTSGQVPTGTPVETLNTGNFLEFDVINETDIIVKDGMMNERNVIATDVQGTNGVIHVVDGVLLP